MLACWAFCETEKEFPMSNVETTVTHVGAPAPQQSPPPIGDNSSKFANGSPNKTSNVVKDQLRSIVARIEQQEAEKADIAEQIRDIYTEAKSNGYARRSARSLRSARKTPATGPNAKRSWTPTCSRWG
jgi:uncharacterized protein (UPF0335 family)